MPPRKETMNFWTDCDDEIGEGIFASPQKGGN